MPTFGLNSVPASEFLSRRAPRLIPVPSRTRSSSWRKTERLKVEEAWRVSPKLDARSSVPRSFWYSTPRKVVERRPATSRPWRPNVIFRVFVVSSNSNGKTSPASAGSFSWKNSSKTLPEAVTATASDAKISHRAPARNPRRVRSWFPSRGGPKSTGASFRSEERRVGEEGRSDLRGVFLRSGDRLRREDLPSRPGQESAPRQIVVPVARGPEIDGHLFPLLRGQHEGVESAPPPGPDLSRTQKGEEGRAVVLQDPVALEAVRTQVEVPPLPRPLGESLPCQGIVAPPRGSHTVLPSHLPLPGEEVHHPRHRVGSVQGALRPPDDLDVLEPVHGERGDVELAQGGAVHREPVDEDERVRPKTSPDLDVLPVPRAAAALHVHPRDPLKRIPGQDGALLLDLLPRHDAHRGRLLGHLLLDPRRGDYDRLQPDRLFPP